MNIKIEKQIKDIIGKDIKKFKNIKYGGANIVYDITTIDNKKYIFKLYNMPRKFYLIDRLNEYLKNNGIKTLNPLANGILDDKHYYLYAKNKGKHRKHYSSKMIDSILDVIYIENQNKMDTIGQKDTIIEKYCLYKDYFFKNTVNKVSLDTIEYINNVSKIIELKNSNFRLIHGDLSTTNILWGYNTMSIIDFDEAIYALIEYELVSFIIKVCFNKGYFDKRLAKEIIKKIKLKFEGIDYYLLKNSWLLFITKVIYEKLYFYELGYIDIESKEHQKDYWKWWFELLKNQNLFDELYFEDFQIEKIKDGINIKNDVKSSVQIVKLSKSKFILKKSKVNKEENANTEREILNLLSLDINVPRILKIKEYKSYIYKLYTYKKGEHKTTYTLGDEQNVIINFKKLNDELSKLNIKTKIGDLEKKIVYLREITNNNFYKRCLNELLCNENFIANIHTEEKQIIHDDLHSNNILFDQDKVIFLDFEGIKKYPKSLQIASFITNFYLYQGEINKLEYIFNEFNVEDKEYIINLIIYRMIKTLIYFEKNSKNQDDKLKEEKIYNTLQEIISMEEEKTWN